MKRWRMFLIAMTMLALPGWAWAEQSVQATLVDFPVTLDGHLVDNAHRQYPWLLVHRVLYFPLDHDSSRFLGLETGWTAQDGLTVAKTGIASVYREARSVSVNSAQLAIEPSDYPITINGERLSAQSEGPCLQFRNVPYLPLTQAICQAFGWQVSYDNLKGLSIAADNPRIQAVKLENRSAGEPFLLAEGRLWAQTGQEIINLPLDALEKRAVSLKLPPQKAEWGPDSWYCRFVQAGGENYLIIDWRYDNKASLWYHLLPDGKWASLAENTYVCGDYQVSIADGAQEETGNLTIRQMKTGKMIACDPSYHYYNRYGEKESILASGQNLYVLAIKPHLPDGTVILRINLASGETTVAASGVEPVLNDGWLYFDGYDDAAGRDAYYRYSLQTGQIEQLAVKRSLYDMSLINPYAVLGNQFYYTDFTERLRGSAEDVPEAEREAYTLEKWQANHSGDADLYRWGEGQSLNPDGRVTNLSQTDDYVWATFAPRTERPVEPYRLMVFDRQGQVVFKTTDAVAEEQVSIEHDLLAYALEGAENQDTIYWVDLAEEK